MAIQALMSVASVGTASQQPAPLLPARPPAAALQDELLLRSAAALQLLVEFDRATWVLWHLVLANKIRPPSLQRTTCSPSAMTPGSSSSAISQSATSPEHRTEQPAHGAGTLQRLPNIAASAPAACKMNLQACVAEVAAQMQPAASQQAAERAEQPADGPCVQAVQPSGSAAAYGTTDLGEDTNTPLRRLSNRIAARQGQREADTDADRDAGDAAGPSRGTAAQAVPRRSSGPPQPPQQQLADAYSSAALRLAYAMSVLLFLALFLPVVAPQASKHISKMLFVAVLGSMTLAVAVAPMLKKPAARLNPMFAAADWEASFLFHDSRGRQLADAMASITACASCTIRLYRALLGNCSGSFVQAAPVVAYFALQALPLALICNSSLWYVRNRETVLTIMRLSTAAIIAGWSTGALSPCRSPNEDLSLTMVVALAVHHALSFQVRFDKHVLLVAVAEAPAQVLRLLLAGRRISAAWLPVWVVALAAVPAAAVWLAERLARRQFAAAQRMGQPGVTAPAPPPDAFFCLPDLKAVDSEAVLAKMAGAEASAYAEPPRLRLD